MYLKYISYIYEFIPLKNARYDQTNIELSTYEFNWIKSKK